MEKPVLFIGSATESKYMVDALEESLMTFVTVRRWDNAFKSGKYTLETLLTQSAQSDFAVFAFGQDDKFESRGTSEWAPRDNVVFEAGLFAHALGLEL